MTCYTYYRVVWGGYMEYKVRKIADEDNKKYDKYIMEFEDGSFCYYYEAYNNKFVNVDAAKTCLNSYRLGLREYNPKYAFLKIQSSGPINDNILEYTALYKRGMQEMKEYLEALDE